MARAAQKIESACRSGGPSFDSRAEAKGGRAMRFTILVKADENTEAGVLPSTEQPTAMRRYNEELARAGVLLAGEGLHSSSKGARAAARKR
jgi:hypothetical protein